MVILRVPNESWLSMSKLLVDVTYMAMVFVVSLLWPMGHHKTGHAQKFNKQKFVFVFVFHLNHS